MNPIVKLRKSSESNKNFPFFLSFENQSISSLDNSAIALKKNDQKEDRITKFKEFRELQRFHMPFSVVKPIDTSFEDKWRNIRQKVATRKQHSKYVQEVHFKSSPFTINDYALNQMIPPNIENTTVLLTNGGLNLQAENKNEVSQGVGGKPSQEQLESIYNNLREEVI